MNIKEFYEQIGGDYTGTLERLMKEERIAKYLGRFKDAEDYPNIFKALEANNIEEIFRFSHNVKGVSLNLGLNRLADSSAKFCDLFRYGAPDKDYSEELEQMKKDYEETIAMIDQIDE